LSFNDSTGNSKFLLRNSVDASPISFYPEMNRVTKNTRIFVVILNKKTMIEMTKGGSINLNNSATRFLGASGS